jgi:SNF2 family DNA or RNA helicase
VFSLYGVKVAVLNGNSSFERRARVVKDFEEDPTIRVMLFSKVGTVGLNLTVADTLIFLVWPLWLA